MEPTAEVQRRLRELAVYLTEHGFDALAEVIGEYLGSAEERASWVSVGELLRALILDVWHGFAQVGDEDERPVYAAAAREIASVREVL